MSQTLNQAAPHIEELVNELQNKGFATDVAQQKAAKEIVVQVQQNRTMKDNLKNWALSLADATISHVVKGTVKIALQSAGIPLP
jgi:arginine deiminase